MNRKYQVTEMKGAGDQFQHSMRVAMATLRAVMNLRYLVIVVLISQVMISVGLSVLIFLTIK